VGLGPHKVLSVPDAIGIAIEEWVRERQVGVQQELMPDLANAETPPSSEIVSTDSMQQPVSVSRLSNGAGQGQPEMEFSPYKSGETFFGTCPDCGSQMEYA